MDHRKPAERDRLGKFKIPRDGTMTDSSGEIHMRIFRARTDTPVSHPSLTIPVDPDYVCIGGGASIEFTGDYQGGFLTASYPSDDLTAWNVASKDHLVPNPHYLVGYAIGLKIDTISRAMLFDYGISRAQNTAGDGGTAEPAHHPVAVAHLNNAVERVSITLGGGFRVNYGGSGSMATASYTNSYNPGAWIAAAKDHEAPDQATITSWVLGIHNNPNDLPGYHGKGRQITGIILQGTPVSVPNYNVIAGATLPNGYVLTGGGGNLEYQEPGSMLQDLIPSTNGSFVVQGRDHMDPAAAILTPYALGIQMLV